MVLHSTNSYLNHGNKDFKYVPQVSQLDYLFLHSACLILPHTHIYKRKKPLNWTAGSRTLSGNGTIIYSFPIHILENAKLRVLISELDRGGPWSTKLVMFRISLESASSDPELCLGPTDCRTRTDPLN